MSKQFTEEQREELRTKTISLIEQFDEDDLMDALETGLDSADNESDRRNVILIVSVYAVAKKLGLDVKELVPAVLIESLDLVVKAEEKTLGITKGKSSHDVSPEKVARRASAGTIAGIKAVAKEFNLDAGKINEVFIMAAAQAVIDEDDIKDTTPQQLVAKIMNKVDAPLEKLFKKE